jgi:mono/diheme cytochrome c family protein
MRKLILMLIGVVAGTFSVQASGPVLPNPILFVTQTPTPSDFTSITALFGNHRGSMDSTPRGGALWIRYPDGTLRNLTFAAGFGHDGPQHTNGIAVREPCVHWDGNKAVFSMVVGAPKKQYEVAAYYWQIYEVTGFGPNETPVITKVSNQPANYNNVAPIYGSDDRIIFASDRPRDGQRHLYPQLDEYEEAPTVTGLWSLDPVSGDLRMMNHSPSGVFSPSVDSFGRVIFSRWDHMQRDQQGDAPDVVATYGTFNYSDESATAQILTNVTTEVFPEPRYTIGTNNAHTFNQFFPWQINQDGTEEETLNHVGRHELGGSYRSAAFNNDPNLVELYYFGNKPNTNTLNNFIQPRESATDAGLFYAIDAPEFGSHSAGQILALQGAPTTNPDLMKLFYITPRSTASFIQDGATPPADDTGLYRNPLSLSDGSLISVHTPETRGDKNIGTSGSPKSRYDFRLKLLKQVNGYYQPDVPLTPGITNNLTWWSPDSLLTYAGEMWELDPAEVRVRARPTNRAGHVDPIEAKIFQDEGVDVENFRTYLKQRNLALIVSRNVTGRDGGDRQQPFNLRVPGGVQTIGAAGTIYEIQYLQLFQGDLLRGTGLRNSAPNAGRRVLAQQLHDPLTDNVPATDASAPVGSVRISSDGSVAALIPARRAMTWQMTAPDGEPVVRERYWVTFQPGEIRTCANCHGVNRGDQIGRPAATNPPQALREFLRHWKTNNVPLVASETISSDQFATITFKRQTAATNLTQRIDISTDLSTWTPASSYTSSGGTQTGVLEEILNLPGAFQTITLRDLTPQTGQPTRFYRVITQ